MQSEPPSSSNSIMTIQTWFVCTILSAVAFIESPGLEYTKTYESPTKLIDQVNNWQLKGKYKCASLIGASIGSLSMSLSVSFTITFAVLIQFIRSETINCSQNEDCACINDGPCIINCVGTHYCRGRRLTCKPNFPCDINCYGENACSNAHLDGQLATNLVADCDSSKACKGSLGEINCGSGDCTLICQGPGACRDVPIYINSAESFKCFGSANQCNQQYIPDEFSEAPTQSPSQTPTQSPSQTPTDNPTTQFCDVNGADSTYMETINVDADAYGGKVRRIIASGCPNHQHIAINPHDAIRNPKDILLPAYPCISDKGNYDTSCVPSSIGITLNGVSIYSVFGGWFCGADAVAVEGDTFDTCGGHSDVNGFYHYHIAPACLLAQLSDSEADNPWQHSPQIGWAYDGFPIYGPHDNNGDQIYACTHPNANSLDCVDECNGHNQHTIDGFKYHYHIQGPATDLISLPTNPLPGPDRSPYTIGCLKGVPFDWGIVAPPHPQATDQTYPTNASCIESGTDQNYDPVSMPNNGHGVTNPFVPNPGPTKAPIYGSPTTSTPPNFLIIVFDDLEYTTNWNNMDR